MSADVFKDVVDCQHREAMIGVAGIDIDFPAGTERTRGIANDISIGLPIDA